MRHAIYDKVNLILASAEAEKSLDPSTQVGAVLLRGDRAVRLSAHNTFLTLADPASASREERYADVLHAEEAVMLKAGPDACAGGTLYCTHEPCQKCWGIAIWMGVGGVVFRRTDEERRVRWGCGPGRAAAIRAGLAIVEVTQ